MLCLVAYLFIKCVHYILSCSKFRIILSIDVLRVNHNLHPNSFGGFSLRYEILVIEMFATSFLLDLLLVQLLSLYVVHMDPKL